MGGCPRHPAIRSAWGIALLLAHPSCPSIEPARFRFGLPPCRELRVRADNESCL